MLKYYSLKNVLDMVALPKPSVPAPVGDGLCEEGRIQALEEYFKRQLTEGSYDFVANKTLLKLYLLFPGHATADKVSKVLLKALLNLPANDFTLLLYILPEKVQQDDAITKIMQAAEALETARYTEFWSTVNGSAAVFDAVPNWRKEIRNIILEVEAAAYKTVTKQWLEGALGLSGGELDAFIAAHKAAVSKVEGGNVVFAPNAHNQSRPRKFREKVDVMSMLDTLNKLSSA